MCFQALELFNALRAAASSFPDATSIAGSLGNAGAWIGHVALATDKQLLASNASVSAMQRFVLAHLFRKSRNSLLFSA